MIIARLMSIDLAMEEFGPLQVCVVMAPLAQGEVTIFFILVGYELAHFYRSYETLPARLNCGAREDQTIRFARQIEVVERK